MPIPPPIAAQVPIAPPTAAPIPLPPVFQTPVAAQVPQPPQFEAREIAATPAQVAAQAAAQAPAPASAPTTASDAQKLSAIVKCESKKDLDYYVLQIQIALNQTEMQDWLPDHITNGIKAVVAAAPAGLKKDLDGVATITAQYDSELDQASKLAVKTIKQQIESINSFKTIQQLVNRAKIEDFHTLATACYIVEKGLAEATEGRDVIMGCAEKLRRDVTPDHDIILKSVKRVTEVIITKEAATFTEEQIKSAGTELQALETTIRNAIHADEERVENAGEEFRRCIFKHAYGIDLDLARTAGRLDVVLDAVHI